MKKAHPAPSYRPLYEQIRVLLTRALAEGEWRPGGAIPSETELAARFRVSQGTVRKAIESLAADNILVRRQGKGTFVATHTEPAVQYRFLRMMPDSGEPVAPEKSFVQLRRGRADAEVARALRVRAGTPVHVLLRLLAWHGRPFVLDEIALAASRFPGLTLAALKAYPGSLYSFYETVYGQRMIRAEERLRAVAADAATARYLRVTSGTPLLCVDRVAFTYDGKPVEWRRGLCVTGDFAYFNELT